MIESLLEKLKKFYNKLLQAQKYRARAKLSRSKHLGGYVW